LIRPDSEQIIPHVNDYPQKATAELEIRVGCSVPEGALVTGEGPRREFFGWTELAAAIEEWRVHVRDGPRDGKRRGEPT
jgi:hypothetical protein